MGRGMKIVIAMSAVLATIFLVGLPLYVFPASDEPRAVDAVFVIGPPTDVRIDLAERMIADGLTDTLVVSLGDSAWERENAPAAIAACNQPQDYTAYCTQPDPFSTRGEARWMRDLVDQHGWESVAVITTTPHISRTRAIFERCWEGEDGGIAYIESGEDLRPMYWVHQYLYQTVAFAKVAVERGC